MEAKIAKRAKGILSREIRKGSGGPGQVQQRFLSAVSHKGLLCEFGTVERLCKRVYELSDGYGLAHVMLTHLLAGAVAAGHDVIACRPPWPRPAGASAYPGPEPGLRHQYAGPAPTRAAPTAASAWTPWPTRRR